MLTDQWKTYVRGIKIVMMYEIHVNYWAAGCVFAPGGGLLPGVFALHILYVLQLSGRVDTSFYQLHI